MAESLDTDEKRERFRLKSNEMIREEFMKILVEDHMKAEERVVELEKHLLPGIYSNTAKAIEIRGCRSDAPLPNIVSMVSNNGRLNVSTGRAVYELRHRYVDGDRVDEVVSMKVFEVGELD